MLLIGSHLLLPLERTASLAPRLNRGQKWEFCQYKAFFSIFINTRYTSDQEQKPVIYSGLSSGEGKS